KRAGAAGPGSELEGFGRVAATLADRVPVLRRRLPAHLIVLPIGSAPERVAVHRAHRAAELRVRGFLLSGEDVEAALRWQLTDREHLAEDFLGWLPSSGVALSEFSRLVIERIFLAALQHQPVGETVRQLGVGSASTIRGRFWNEGLPSP